jgi:hypothetical protein
MKAPRLKRAFATRKGQLMALAAVKTGSAMAVTLIG